MTSRHALSCAIPWMQLRSPYLCDQQRQTCCFPLTVPPAWAGACFEHPALPVLQSRRLLVRCLPHIPAILQALILLSCMHPITWTVKALPVLHDLFLPFTDHALFPSRLTLPSTSCLAWAGGSLSWCTPASAPALYMRLHVLQQMN